MALRGVEVTLLEKAARDNGFDLVERVAGADWLRAASTQAKLVVWLTSIGGEVFLVAFSEQKVLAALVDEGTPFTSPMPKGAEGGLTVTSLSGLNALVRQAFRLSRTLPDELLHQFEARMRESPLQTEAEQLIRRRVGQDIFRAGLLERWDGRCVVTGLDVPELLRASHIKPWAACDTDRERLDSNNGLLLAAHLDAAFDQGFITFEDDGRMVVSPALPGDAREVLGLSEGMRVRRLTAAHRPYLDWHRQRVFRRGRS